MIEIEYGYNDGRVIEIINDDNVDISIVSLQLPIHIFLPESSGRDKGLDTES